MLVSRLGPPLSANSQKKMSAIEIINHAQVAIPTVVRLVAQPLVKEIITHCYHKAVHAGIHLGSHKVHCVGHCLKKYPVVIDAVVILAMLAFGALTEQEGGESHESHLAE
jgi:hypothetical protein